MKVLFLSDSYYPKPLANGICIHEIAESFIKDGNEVHVLAYKKNGDKPEGLIGTEHVHRITPNLYNRCRFYLSQSTWKNSIAKAVMILLNRVSAMLFLWCYPFRFPVFTYRYCRKATKLVRQFQYDLIIASYCPMEAAIAAAYVKKRCKNVKICLYTLDSLSNHTDKLFLKSGWREKKGWSWEKKLFPKYDLILNLNCHRRHFENKRYDQWRDHMEIVDIPLLREVKIQNDRDERSGGLKWVYAGNLYADTSEVFFRVFDQLARDSNDILNIYSKNDCKNYLRGLAAKNINYHGYVERNIAMEAEQSADILVSLGVYNSCFIPSKIFEYISTGKRIIHFYRGYDSSKEYYERYPNVVLIDVDGNFQENIDKISEFLRQPCKEVSYGQLKDMYPENVPEYTKNVIIKQLKLK